jgi:hypothetical protein
MVLALRNIIPTSPMVDKHTCKTFPSTFNEVQAVSTRSNKIHDHAQGTLITFPPFNAPSCVLEEPQIADS